MDVGAFEDSRWGSFQQKKEFRHTATLSLIKNGLVLDIGCGDGLLLQMLKEKGLDAIGVDISSEAINQCQNKALKAELVGTAEKLPFPDNSFDYVVMLDVLEHVYTPETFLAEAKRVSKKYIIVGVPNFSSLPARLQVLLGRVPENNKPNKAHVYWFNKNVLENLVKKVGLKFISKQMNTFRPFFYFGNFFTNVVPNSSALSFVVLLEK